MNFFGSGSDGCRSGSCLQVYRFHIPGFWCYLDVVQESDSVISLKQEVEPFEISLRFRFKKFNFLTVQFRFRFKTFEKYGFRFDSGSLA